MNCARAFWRKASIYTLHGDYSFPDIAALEDCGSLGKWMNPHLIFLEEHQPDAWAERLFVDKLILHLRDFRHRLR